MKQRYIMSHELARQRAIDAVRNAPAGYVIEIREPTRTLDQNAKFHAICSDVEKAGAKWMNKPMTAQQWKVLFVSGHAVASGSGAEVVPGLEGEFVNIRESTARMSKNRGASLIEYVLAWCAENEILLPSYGGDVDASYIQNGLRGAGVREANRTSVCADRR